VPLEGFGGFSLGFFHVLSTPSQALAIAALGFMLGLRWPKWLKISWVAFAAATFLGMCLGQFGVMLGWEMPMLLLIASLAAMISALHPPGFYLAFVLLPCLGGLLLGLLSTPDSASLQASVISLSGSFIGAKDCSGLDCRYIDANGFVGVGRSVNEVRRWRNTQLVTGMRLVMT
jgi:hypothetical protein